MQKKFAVAAAQAIRLRTSREAGAWFAPSAADGLPAVRVPRLRPNSVLTALIVQQAIPPGPPQGRVLSGQPARVLPAPPGAGASPASPAIRCGQLMHHRDKAARVSCCRLLICVTPKDHQMRIGLLTHAPPANEAQPTPTLRPGLLEGLQATLPHLKYRYHRAMHTVSLPEVVRTTVGKRECR